MKPITITGAFGAFALAALAVSTPALAHSPYLLPNAFEGENLDHVTVEASFSEHVFTPAIAMLSDGYAVVGPDGTAQPLKPVVLRDLVVLEVPTASAGIYRITTGDREGRTAKAALIDGTWEFLDPRRPVPAGITPVDMQSVTKAEAYVTRGTPGDRSDNAADQRALAPSGKGIEYRAITPPDRIRAGQPARFQLLFDGKPLAKADVEVEQGRLGDVENVRLPLITSDARGEFTIIAPAPGLYFAMTRYRIGAASGNPARSYTYALTFSATK